MSSSMDVERRAEAIVDLASPPVLALLHSIGCGHIATASIAHQIMGFDSFQATMSVLARATDIGLLEAVRHDDLTVYGLTGLGRALGGAPYLSAFAARDRKQSRHSLACHQTRVNLERWYPECFVLAEGPAQTAERVGTMRRKRDGQQLLDGRLGIGVVKMDWSGYRLMSGCRPWHRPDAQILLPSRLGGGSVFVQQEIHGRWSRHYLVQAEGIARYHPWVAGFLYLAPPEVILAIHKALKGTGLERKYFLVPTDDHGNWLVDDLPETIDQLLDFFGYRPPTEPPPVPCTEQVKIVNLAARYMFVTAPAVRDFLGLSGERQAEKLLTDAVARQLLVPLQQPPGMPARYRVQEEARYLACAPTLTITCEDNVKRIPVRLAQLSLGAWLTATFPTCRVLTEKELRLAEETAGTLLLSPDADLYTGRSSRRPYAPTLALIPAHGSGQKAITFFLTLSQGGDGEVHEARCRAHRDNSRVQGTIVVTSPRHSEGLRRKIANANAEARVRLAEFDPDRGWEKQLPTNLEQMFGQFCA